MNQYATAVENYLTYGLRDLYVRTLKALSIDNAEIVALRVLSQSVAKRKGNYSFALSSDDEYKIKSPKRDPVREAAIARAVRAEVDLMGTMQTYNDAFRFLHRLKWRLEQDDAHCMPRFHLWGHQHVDAPRNASATSAGTSSCATSSRARRERRARRARASTLAPRRLCSCGSRVDSGAATMGA